MNWLKQLSIILHSSGISDTMIMNIKSKWSQTQNFTIGFINRLETSLQEKTQKKNHSGHWLFVPGRIYMVQRAVVISSISI